MPTERRTRKTLTGATPKKRENKYQTYGATAIYCYCDNDPRRETVRRTCQNSDKGNVGCEFWTCDIRPENCGFFAWHDELAKNGHPGWGESHPSDEEEDAVFGRGGDRLVDGYITPPPSTQSSAVSAAGPSSPRKNKKRRAVREPSPDWPGIDKVTGAARRVQKEKARVGEGEDQLKKENDGFKTENSRLLAKVYPKVFGDRVVAA